jgi:hypothetical protein
MGFEIVALGFFLIVLMGGGRLRIWAVRHLPANQVPPRILVLAVRIIAFMSALAILSGLVDRLVLRR